MADLREVIIVMDWEDEKVRAWFERVIGQVGHPQYQGRIRVVGPVESE